MSPVIPLSCGSSRNTWNACLRALTPGKKLVLSLYYTDGLTMREAAEVMSITECRVSQLHAQALARSAHLFGQPV